MSGRDRLFALAILALAAVLAHAIYDMHTRRTFIIGFDYGTEWFSRHGFPCSSLDRDAAADSCWKDSQ